MMPGLPAHPPSPCRRQRPLKSPERSEFSTFLPPPRLSSPSQSCSMARPLVLRKRKMTLIVYEHPLSPYAQKVKIALDEKGLDYAVKMPVAMGTGLPDHNFLAANPRGEVPTLIDGDLAIIDSTIILEYIEDKWPSPRLLPQDPAARADARTIEDVMDTQFEAIIWGM